MIKIKSKIKSKKKIEASLGELWDGFGVQLVLIQEEFQRELRYWESPVKSTGEHTPPHRGRRDITS